MVNYIFSNGRKYKETTLIAAIFIVEKNNYFDNFNLKFNRSTVYIFFPWQTHGINLELRERQ